MKTNSRGYAYPETTDAPDGPTQIKALADSVASDVATVAASVATNAAQLAVIPYRAAAGSVTFTVSSAANTGTVAITFPSGRFSVAPLVVASITNSPSGATKVQVRTKSATSSGTTLEWWTGDGTTTTFTNLTVAWQAVQMNSSSAAG